jgi:hypothetical protein
MTDDTPQPRWANSLVRAHPSDPRRTATGLFIKGNTAAKGNPVAKRMHDRRTLLLSETTDDDVREVWAAIKRDAKEGDPVARKLFCDYVFGRPVQGVELTTTSSEDMETALAVLKSKLVAFADRLAPEQRYELASFLVENNDESTNRDGDPA